MGEFKVGDFVFCEFELVQIARMEDGKVIETRDGMFSRSFGGGKKCYNLSLSTKNIAEAVKYWSKRFHELKLNSLNHPDLNRKLIEIFEEMCDNINDVTFVDSKMKELDSFGQGFIDKVNLLTDEHYGGVRIFR